MKDNSKSPTQPAKKAAAKASLAPKAVTLFYSWQSDLGDDANRNGIRNALRAVKKAVKSDVALKIDEATRDSPGSPNIPNKIIEKIRACDLFVADVTTITGKKHKGRPCANPNVVFELGYAVAHVGWDRIILLVNGKVSPLSDLPFDFDRHRAMRYEHDAVPTSKQKDALASSLRIGIEMIAKHDPPRPWDLEGKTPEQIRRARDAENIRWALEQIHQPSLDQFAMTMPDQLLDEIFWYYESFKGVVSSSLFHISDPDLAKLFEDMLAGWSKALSGGAHFRMASNPRLYIWDGDRDPRGPKAKERILKGIRKLERARKALLERIRDSYVEVDIDAANKLAFESRRKDEQGDD